MWVLLKSLLAKWAVLKLVLRAFGSLGWLLPLAFILKALGLPFLIMLAILALPLLLVLGVLGLPLLLVAVVGGVLVTITMWFVSLGIAALKLAVPLVIAYWLVRWMSRRGDEPPASPPPTTPPPATSDAA